MRNHTILSDNKVISEILAHAKKDAPRESCGLVIVKGGKYRYIACRNLSESDNNFQIDPQDYANAEDLGEIAYIVHSHPAGTAQPSEADKVSCEISGLPWLIVGADSQALIVEPTGYKAPLVGRPFCHGVLDCYSLIRDYYSETFGVDLMDFERREEWWHKGDNLYLDNFEKAGFHEVSIDDIQKHDVVIMQIGANVPNHAAVYIGDGLIIQHCSNRLSSRDVLGGYWLRCVVKVVRYSGIKNA